ncbi:MAG: biosynthetic-type acetolactate synthase large subunit [Lachnospiraceae bacterium]|nr:biosynthetic-type acetolactate synthase large subunit [Lachnospiraceae bacterium]
MTGSDAMVQCLEKEGVTTVFGYPGVAICPFYNSILDTKIQTVLVRTEQNAAHMASGMARLTGKPGVCAVTSGPGATNVITGIATAFADSIPLVCITGQVESSLLGSDVFQEADITGATESFVKYSYLVKDVGDIPRIIKEAFHIANTGRKGPVLIDVPFDVQRAQLKEFTYPSEVSIRTYKPTVKGHAVQIKKVITQLQCAKRPIICVGGGVLLAQAQQIVRSFAEKHKIPVVSTMMGIGVMPTEHPQNYGMVGNNGNTYANRAMNESDLLLMVGARVADRAVSQPGLITQNKVLVHIDVDPAEIGKNAGPTIPLVGDAAHIFSQMHEEAFASDYTQWNQTLSRYRTQAQENTVSNPSFVNPASLLRSLSLAMEEDAIYVADVGQNQIWSCRYHVVKKGRFLTSGGMGTMGYSIPAAMGAKIACPQRQVVAVCGDGSFQMSMMELATMRQHGIAIKIVVIQNGSLGMVREFQHFSYEDHYSVIDLSGSPDLSKIAEAYGLPFIRIVPDGTLGNRSSQEEDQMKRTVYEAHEMEEAIAHFLDMKGSVLMECQIDPMALVKIPNNL